MNKFRFMLCLALLVSGGVSGQVTQPVSSPKSTIPPYKSAILQKMTAKVQTQTEVFRQTQINDSSIVTDRIVTYEFRLQCGSMQYLSRYTPEKQPGNLPDEWWAGSAHVPIRVDRHTLYMKLPDGRQIATQLKSVIATSK